MPKIEYKSIKFQQKSLELIRLVNQVVEEYQAQGYELTLRQAYYQLVARGYIPNNERSYKNIGNLINDGRLAGLIDWYSITDRTRNLRSNPKPENPIDGAMNPPEKGRRTRRSAAQAQPDNADTAADETPAVDEQPTGRTRRVRKTR